MINTTAQNTLKNSGYNFIGFIMPLLVFIFATPIIIAGLGVEQYGIYVLLSATLALLGLLDLGVSVANNKHIVEYYSTKQFEKLQKLVYSMNSVFALLAMIYIAVCTGIGFVVQYWVYAHSGYNHVLLFFLIGVIGATSTIFGNFFSSLFVLQKIRLHITINTVFMVLQNLNLALLAYFGYTLSHILAVQVLLTIGHSLTFFFVAKRIFPIMKLKYMWVAEEIIKNYKYGLNIALNNIASSSLVHFDKLIIPIFVGPAQLAYYSVPGAVTNRITSVSSTFSSLLFPIAVSLHSLNDREKLKRVYQRSVRLIAILSVSISFSIIIVADKILLYWVGEDFAQQATGILILLTITNCILAIFNPLSQVLTAINEIKFLTKGSVIMAIVNLSVLFVLLPVFGITGAAIAYLVGVLPIVGMFYVAEKKYFSMSYTKQYVLLFLKLFVTCIPFFSIMKILVYPILTSFFSIVVLLPLCVGLFLILYKVFGFVEWEDWNDAKLFFGSLIKKNT